jgi:hypothetical protein
MMQGARSKGLGAIPIQKAAGLQSEPSKTDINPKSMQE